MKNDRERTLHHNMLFPLGLQRETESVLIDIGGSANSGNPVPEQVDNFPTSDGEVDQPVYKGPQTWSHTRNLMKANILMDQMFDVEESSITNKAAQSESFRDLILKFWYQQVFAVYMVCCGLVEAGTRSINC